MRGALQTRPVSKASLIATIGCALAIAACGSSHKATPTAGRSQFLQFSECMRSHGVTNFPDPSAGGGIHLNADINPFSPSFKAAQSACRKLLPGGGPPSHPSEQDKQADAPGSPSACAPTA